MNMNNGWILLTWKFPNRANFPKFRLKYIVMFLLLIVHSVIIEEREFERLFLNYLYILCKDDGKYINSFCCHNNCKINHITYYCYLFSFYISKTEQHYKVNTANIHQGKLSFWWQFVSWKWEGENKPTTSPRKAGEKITHKFQSCIRSFLS